VKALVVTGIWPPDVGGPASHAPALATFLAGRGHGVEVVTTADSPPAAEAYPVRFVSRRLPPGVRHAAVSALVARVARHTDVVYATSMSRRAVAGAAAARRPVVVKVTADEAYERARRTGLFSGSLDSFQEHPGGVRIRALRASRTAALRRASHVVFPSAYLRRLALAWGLDAARTSVLPNPAPELPPLPPRDRLRASFRIDGPTLAFAGRLMAAKALDVAFEALAEVDGVALLVAGDGPDRPALEIRAASLGLGARVRFLGAQPRGDVLSLFRAADAVLLSSAWENFPHTVVEALAVGTPVVATAVGGIPEVVRDGENGLLVPPGDPRALAAAMRRVVAERGLRELLAVGALASAAAYEPALLLGRLEGLLEEAIRP
jgi:glycosyltransferase involved in cell wall biosynthesis